MLFRRKELAPEPCLSAYHYLLYSVFLRLRSNGGKMSPEELSDLGNALHNVPHFLMEYGSWDDKTYRERYLLPYDEKWSKKQQGPSLVEMLEEGLALTRDRDKLSHSTLPNSPASSEPKT